jgi:hypothetical protein
MPVIGRLQHPVSITEKQLTNLTESGALVNFLHNAMRVFCIESASLGLSGTSVGHISGPSLPVDMALNSSRCTLISAKSVA